MAIEFKRGRAGGSGDEDDRRRREAERTREQFGLATLSADEELIDDETFSRLHDALEAGRRTAGPDVPPEADGADADAESEAEADELLLEEIATVLPTQSAGVEPGRDSGPPADAAEVAALERRLLDAKDRDEVAELALRIARYHGEACALFVVNKGLVAGLRGSGGGLEHRIEGIMIPSEADSLMTAAIASRRLARAAAPLGSVDQRVLRALGREGVQQLAVLPIAIGPRVLNLLYVDAGQSALAETSLAALRVLCSAVGFVYERLILERRRAASPAGASQPERRVLKDRRRPG